MDAGSVVYWSDFSYLPISKHLEILWLNCLEVLMHSTVDTVGEDSDSIRRESSATQWGYLDLETVSQD